MKEETVKVDGVELPIQKKEEIEEFVEEAKKIVEVIKEKNINLDPNIVDV